MERSEKPKAAIVGRAVRGWIPVMESGTGWLLFKYNPDRRQVEIKRRGQKTVVTLPDGGKNQIDKP